MRFATHDSHSSRRTIARALKLSTRWQREPRLSPAYLILLRMEVTAFHPFRRMFATFAAHRSNRLVSVALFLASRRTAVSRHPALCSPDFPLLISEQRLSGQLLCILAY